MHAAQRWWHQTTLTRPRKTANHLTYVLRQIDDSSRTRCGRCTLRSCVTNHCRRAAIGVYLCSSVFVGSLNELVAE